MNCKSILRGLVAVVLVGASVGEQVYAVSNTWNGATGVWLSAGNWTGGVNIPGSTTTANSDVATFNINVSPTVGIDMNFAGNIYFMGALEKGSSATTARIINNSNTTVAGTLSLSGATVNSVSNVIIRNNSSSALTLNNGTGTGTMAVDLSTAGNNKIVIDAAGGVVINSNITGVGGIEMIRNTGSSRLDFGGNNSYAGDTVLTSGRFRVLNTAVNGIPNGAGKGNVVMSAGTQFGVTVNETINGLSGSGTVDNDATSGTATLTIGENDATSTYDGLLINSGGGILAVTKTGAGTLTLTGANTYSGLTTVSAGGTLKLGAAGVIPDGAGKGSVTLNGTLDLNAFDETINGLSGAGTVDTIAGGVPTFTINTTANSTFSGVIQNTAGTLTLVKTGTSAQILSGANTYAGPTTISAGTLQFAQKVSLYNDQAGYWTDPTKLIVESGAVAAFNIGGTGEFAVADVQTLMGASTATGGFKSGSSVGLDTTSGDLTYSDVLADTNGGNNVLGLAKRGTNTLTLSAANTFTGSTAVVAGTLMLAHTNALRNSTLTTGGIAFDQSVGTNAFTLGGLSGSGAISLQNNAGSPAAVAVSIGNNNASTTYSGVLSGPGSITKIGTSSLTLSGASTFSGGVTVSTGTLVLGASSTGSITNGPVGTGTLTMSGGNLTGATANRTIANAVAISASTTNGIFGSGFNVILNGTLTGSGTIDNSLDPGASSNSVVINGDISGFSGTYINNRVVGTSDIYRFTGTTAASYDGSAAKFVLNGDVTSVTSNLTRIATVDGATFKMGQLSGTGGVIRDDLNGNLADQDMTLEVGHLGIDSTWNGVLFDQPAGAGPPFATILNFAKVGGGKLTLGGNNLYKGTTAVNAGTLVVNGTHTGGGAYTVAGGALAGTGTIDTSSQNAGVTVSAGGKLGSALSADTLDMNLGSGVLNISGAVAASSSQSMVFNLDAPGVSDQIILTSGSLNIGSNVLEFNDFAFIDLGGLVAGPYTLFDTSTPITGALGSTLSGAIGAFTGTISLENSNNDIVLTLTPGVAGDYNGDTKVNAADYVTWRKDPTNPNYGGDPAGYNNWRVNFGNPPASGSVLSAGSVPEPGAIFLAVAAGLGLFLPRRTKLARRQL